MGALLSSKQRTGMAGSKGRHFSRAFGAFGKTRPAGMAGARTRAMVVGIPNVGKSTLSTALRAAPRARAADKPGVTRGKQWVSAGEYDLLDMPGVLWKKFESDEVAANLAFIGAIRDEILDD